MPDNPPNHLGPLLSALKVSGAELRDAVLAAVAAEMPDAAHVTGDVLDRGLGVIVGANCKTFAREPLTTIDHAELRDVGRHWTQAGIQPGVQEAITVVASQATYRFLVRLAARTRFTRKRHTQDAIETAGETLLSASLLVHRLVMEGARATRPYRGPEPDPPTTMLDRLLAASGASWPAVEAEVAAAGYAEPFGLLIVAAVPTSEGTALDVVGQRAAARMAGQCATPRLDPIPHVAVIAPGVDATTWPAQVAAVGDDVSESGCSVLAAPYPVGLRVVPAVHEMSRKRLAFRSVWPTASPVIDVADLDTFAMLDSANELLRAHLFDRVLGALLDQPKLFHVLDALVVAGQVRDAATVLGAPYPTVRSQVKRIEELTRRDWTNPSDAYQLTQATRLRWLAALSLARFDESAWGPIPRFSLLGGWR